MVSFDPLAGLSPLEVIDTLLTLQRASFNTRYLAIASFSLFSYDHIITLEQEVCTTFSSDHCACTTLNLFSRPQVEYFWKGEWSISRVLFFLVSPLTASVKVPLILGSVTDLNMFCSRIDTSLWWLECKCVCFNVLWCTAKELNISFTLRFGIIGS